MNIGVLLLNEFRFLPIEEVLVPTARL